MNREQIIQMAREAGARAQQNKNCDVEYLFSVEQIERLLAAEREKFCAMLRQMHDIYSLQSDSSALRAREQA